MPKKRLFVLRSIGSVGREKEEGCVDQYDRVGFEESVNSWGLARQGELRHSIGDHIRFESTAERRGFGREKGGTLL